MCCGPWAIAVAFIWLPTARLASAQRSIGYVVSPNVDAQPRQNNLAADRAVASRETTFGDPSQSPPAPPRQARADGTQHPTPGQRIQQVGIRSERGFSLARGLCADAQLLSTPAPGRARPLISRPGRAAGRARPRTFA